MKFLVLCDHEKTILDVASAKESRAQFKCKRCVIFDMKASAWVYRDVRIYAATERDLAALSHGSTSTMDKRKKPVLDQLDWVEINKCVS